MPSNFRTRAHNLVDLLADHLEQSTLGKGKAIPYRTPEDAYAYWSTFEGSGQELFEAVLAQSTAVHHPGYVGHQVAVPNTEAILASWVSDVLNNGSAVYEMGMAANAIERRVTEQLGRAFGLPHGSSGIFTSGGSLANLTAMLSARAAKAPSAPAESLCVLVSDQAHYCIDRAVRIMGWGEAGTVLLATDDKFQVTEQSLNAGLQEAANRGRTPIALVGMACSTSTGTYDDLSLLAAFAKTHDLWFHIDAAHGGAAGFSDSEKHLVEGIQHADSITLDAHKMMQVPALTTALLFARATDSYRTFAQKADYLWAEDEGEWYHSGQRTVECTKLMMGLRVFAVLQETGLAGIGSYVASRHQLAQAFAKTIHNTPNWQLAVEPMSNIVCFRHTPPAITEPAALDAHNLAIRNRLLHNGNYYVVSTKLRGVFWLRITLMNPLTTLEHLKEILEIGLGDLETN